MKLTLGTAQFGLDYGIANISGRVPSDEVRRILALAKKSGINTIDTAITYGASEKVLGDIGVDDFSVISKLPPLPDSRCDVSYWVQDQFEASLTRLNQRQIYGLLLHNPRDLLFDASNQLIHALLDLKNAGAVRKIGVSIYNSDELDEITKKIQIDLVQAPLNIIDRRMETSGWLERLKDAGVEIHTRSVFLQGLLLMKRQDIPTKFSRWCSIWDAWHEMLQHSGISPIAACLAYPLSLNQIDRVVVGADNIQQLQEIVEAAKYPIVGLDTSFMSSIDFDLVNPPRWSDI